MPWTAPQLKLFRAAAHSPKIAAQHHLSPSKARKMASEGLKPSPKDYAKALAK